jgi:hypothetical protein
MEVPMRIRILSLIILLAFLLALAMPVKADGGYYFKLPQLVVNIYWNSDGTESIDYLYSFINDPSSGPIELVDVGIPNSHYDIHSIYADVDGKAAIITTGDYLGSGPGVSADLRPNSIQPGKSGKVHVFIGVVERVLHEDTEDSTYASADFSPSTFGSQYVDGTTDLTITYHFPPGVQPEEPKWHDAPSGFPSEPQTGFDKDDRIIYTWENKSASASAKYLFGASFPKKYVPEGSIVKQTIFEKIFVALGISTTVLAPCGFTLLCVGGIIGISVLGSKSANQRKLKYLPPKISIEGHGIKRGLTAVEAAILMEQPVDKIMTMILFSTLKKNAAEVVKRDPLEIKSLEPQPENMNTYEKEFLAAFQADAKSRRQALQDVMINLVKSVSEKMKGFSRRETSDYYKSIMTRAWEQVEAANTPEVKSQKFDEVMEWTMLDRDFSDRTRDIFRTQPVFVPMWWGRYDPVFRTSPSSTSAAPSGGMPSLSMPKLPGSDFAASIVTGVQNFSGKVVGNITDFTSGITNKTNPVPVTSYASRSGSSGRGIGGGGGGRSCACACACACAGCACACAGGGR